MTIQQPTSELLSRVAQRIASQRFLPVSPGVFADGEPVFCAGAAFIYEAAQALNPSAASGILAQELLANGTNGLRLKAKELNLDGRMVDSVISTNDSFSDGERKTKMHETILKLAAESRDKGSKHRA